MIFQDFIELFFKKRDSVLLVFIYRGEFGRMRRSDFSTATVTFFIMNGVITAAIAIPQFFRHNASPIV